MNRNRILTIISLVFILIFTGCGKNQVSEKQTEESTQEMVRTSLIINEEEIRLGMTLEEIKASFSEEEFIKEGPGTSLPIKEDTKISKYISNDKMDNRTLGQNAYVEYIYDIDNNLIGVWVLYSAGTVYNQEIIFKELKESYGEEYDVICMENAHFFETYRWDTNDGVTILWELETEPGLGTCIYMVYTEDVEEPEEILALGKEDGYVVIRENMLVYMPKEEELFIPYGVESIFIATRPTNRDTKKIYIPESVKKIEGNIFRATENELTVYIPSSVNEIKSRYASCVEKIVDEGMDKVTLVVEAGSYAEEYAKDMAAEYGTKYEVVGKIEYPKEK